MPVDRAHADDLHLVVAPHGDLDGVARLAPPHLLVELFLGGHPHAVDADDLIAAAEAGAQFAGYTVIRLPYAIEQLFKEWLENHFPDRAAKVLGRLREMRGTWGAESFGLPTAPFDDLRGGDVTANLATVEAILSGRAPSGLVDTIVLNAAAALLVVGRTRTIAEGLAPVRELLLGGAVRAKIAATREFYAA